MPPKKTWAKKKNQPNLDFKKAVVKIEKNLLKKMHITAPEMKYKEIIGFNQTIPIAGQFVLLNGMIQNALNGSRVAQKITVARIEVEFQVTSNVAPIGGTDSGQVFLLTDVQVNATAPTSVGCTIGTDVYAPYNYMSVNNSSLNKPNATLVSNDGKSFIIHKTWNYLVNPQYVGQTNATPVYRKTFAMNKITHYDYSNVGDVTDIQTNAIYFGYGGNQIIGLGTAQSSINFYIRMYYTDL